jgi:hypothetical protein
MSVGVDDAWIDGSSGEIDPQGVRPGEREDLVRRPDREDPVATDCDGFVNHTLRGHWDHGSIEEDESRRIGGPSGER